MKQTLKHGWFPDDGKRELDSQFLNRVLAAIFMAEFFVYLIFVFWPKSKSTEGERIVYTSEEAVSIETVEITQHSSRPPPPPPPVAPIPVPNDVIIPDEIVIPEVILPEAPVFSDSEIGVGQEEGSEQIVGNPARPPSVIKIVEPVFPTEAQKANVKAIVVIAFLVNSDGSVQESHVAEIRSFNSETKMFEKVDKIGFGLVEAALQAASKWRFRSAKHGGKNVRAYTQHEFTFGL